MHDIIASDKRLKKVKDEKKKRELTYQELKTRIIFLENKISEIINYIDTGKD